MSSPRLLRPAGLRVCGGADGVIRRCRERRVRCGREASPEAGPNPPQFRQINAPSCSIRRVRGVKSGGTPARTGKESSCGFSIAQVALVVVRLTLCCSEESVEGSEQQRITDLENKIGEPRQFHQSDPVSPRIFTVFRVLGHTAALQQQLRLVTSGSTLPPPPNPLTAAPAPTGQPPAALTRNSLAYEISRHLTESLSLSETTTLHNLIAEEGGHQRGDAYGAVDQRLASNGLADAVTCFLLDGERLIQHASKVRRANRLLAASCHSSLRLQAPRLRLLDFESLLLQVSTAKS